MDFGFSEEQEILRRSARDFLERECSMTFVRRMIDDETGFSSEVWRQIAELGWLGLAFPESVGGAGLSFIDLAILLEEMGRVALPGPFFSSVLLGGLAILEGGSDEQKARWLPSLVEGRLKATLALVEANGAIDGSGIETVATIDGAGYRIAGTKLFVPDAHVADLLLVVARTTKKGGPEDLSLFAVEVPSRSVRVSLTPTLDPTRRWAEVVLDQARVGAEERIGPAGGAWPILSRVLDRAKVGLAAEMCGGAERALEIAVEYAKVRTQFDRPIGSFQAVQHLCANMLLQIEAAKTATARAAWALASDDPEAPLAAAMAKAKASETARAVAADAIQVHGGIGFTWEHDMHIYFKRAKASELTFGDANRNRELVARHAGL